MNETTNPDFRPGLLTNLAHTGDLILITQLDDPTALHCHYPGQHTAQDTYLLLDLRDGQFTADYYAEPGENRRPMAVDTGHLIRWTIPTLTATAANQLLADLAPTAQRILNDHDEHWDGNNWTVTLGPDALTAYDLIDEATGGSNEYGYHGDYDAFTADQLVAEYDADWTRAEWDVAADYRITATTTDAQLHELEPVIGAEVSSWAESGVAVIHNLDRYLTDLRDDLRYATAA